MNHYQMDKFYIVYKKISKYFVNWRWRRPSGWAVDLLSGDPGFKSSVLPLDRFVFGHLEFNFSTLCK